MPGYARLRGCVWYRKNSHCEISQELSLKPRVISKYPWESYLTSLSLFLGLERGNSDLLPQKDTDTFYTWNLIGCGQM